MLRGRGARVLVIAALIALTALELVRIDATSHSASDTLRPLVIQMAPVWALAVAVLFWRRPAARS